MFVVSLPHVLETFFLHPYSIDIDVIFLTLNFLIQVKPA